MYVVSHSWLSPVSYCLCLYVDPTCIVQRKTTCINKRVIIINKSLLFSVTHIQQVSKHCTCKTYIVSINRANDESCKYCKIRICSRSYYLVRQLFATAQLFKGDYYFKFPPLRSKRKPYLPTFTKKHYAPETFKMWS